MSQATFRTLRDPRPGARLPFLLCLPVAGEAELVLACAVSWPGARDAYCLQLERCPVDAELVEEVPVDGCWRSGASVHLVLGRRDRRRSLFVWTSGRRGRTVYWRTQKTMTAARPGMRVPAARGLDRPLDIAMDQRERYPWKFAKHRANLERRLLPVGDYGVFAGDRLVAVVERKTPANLAADAVSGALGFALAELERLPSACVVVEGRLSDVLAAAEGHVKPGWLLSVLAALQVAHPRVSWVYAENRSLAEDFAYRWLAAAGKATPPEAAGAAPGASAQEPSPTQPRLLDAPTAYIVRDRPGRQAEAWRLALRGRVWTSAAYALHFAVSRATARLDLADLATSGRLESMGGRKSRRYVAAQPRAGD